MEVKTMKILRYVLLSILTLLPGFQVKADWTSVKFIDRVNTAVQNGNAGTWTEKITKAQPRPLNSGWTSVNFIDRVNAWQERMPAKVIQAPQIETSPIGAQEMVSAPAVEAPASFVEKAKAVVVSAKDMAYEAVKNAYTSPVTQDVVKNLKDNKKLVAGLVVGATALYGGYKLYSYFTKSSPVDVSAQISEQERLFQERYKQFVAKSKTAKVVSSMNAEAQIGTILSYAPGEMPATAKLTPYRPARTL